MRLLICGGRHFDDAIKVENELSLLHARAPISVLIHGGMPGIGMPAEGWARRNNVHLVRYPANWSMGKCGDTMRDRFMLADSRPDGLLAFPGGRRTDQLVCAAAERGLPVTRTVEDVATNRPLPLACRHNDPPLRFQAR